MSRDFWLGVAALPSLVVVGAGLWLVLARLERGVARLANRLLTGHAEHAGKRADLGAVMACARRSWWLSLPFDSVLILAVGHDLTQFAEIRSAIGGVLRPAPKVRDADSEVVS